MFISNVDGVVNGLYISVNRIHPAHKVLACTKTLMMTATFTRKTSEIQLSMNHVRALFTFRPA